MNTAYTKLLKRKNKKQKTCSEMSIGFGVR